MKVKKNRNIRGGKMIARGAYGCVYDPPLKCKGREDRGDGVTKLISRMDALDELTEQKKVDIIDPQFEYHLMTPEMCQLGDFDKDNDNNLLDCKSLVDKYSKEDLVLLKMENGGRSLKQFLPKLKKMKIEEQINFICGMKNLFKGLVDFVKNNFLHLDIKLDNIVYKEETNRFNFIDFGLSTNIGTFWKNSRFLIDAEYYAYPGDIFLLSSKNIDIIKNNVKENLDYTELNIPKPVVHSMVTINFNIRNTGDIYNNLFNNKSLNNECLTLTELITNRWRDLTKNEIREEYLKKIDVFSIGMVFVSLFLACTHKQIKFNNTGEIISDTELHPFFEDLQNFINDLIRPYYIDRHTPEKAYEEFVKICDKYTIGATISSGEGAAAASGNIVGGKRNKYTRKNKHTRKNRRSTKKNMIKNKNIRSKKSKNRRRI
jgi:serine/threonine protein kinase